MKRWLAICAGVGLAGLAVGADPPKKADSPKPAEVIPEAEQGEGVTLTIYNQDFVVVKERRTLDLKQGRSSIRFRDVAATIVPETVQFATLRQADAARVVEQNYEFDLVNADKLLDKYIDRQIAIVMQDGQVLKGQLLSFDPGQLVLKTGTGIELVPRDQNIKDVQFSALPGGLLTRPTLVWQIDAKNTGKELVKVAYRANKMNWHVDYRARLNQAGDQLDLAGWVTVSNNTGTAYKDAHIKLMAGDVHIVQEALVPAPMVQRRAGAALAARAPAAFTEKSFAEYHLYELGRNATVKDHETKQIELLDVTEIPISRHYTYRGQGNKVEVVLQFKNDKTVRAGLGIPLPKGSIRVFQHDRDGQLEFAGTDNIDHTAKDELVSIRLGYASDLIAERKQTNVQRGLNQQEQAIEIHLRNHKTEAVLVDVVERINGHATWTMLQQNHPFTQRDVNTLIFPVEVKPNSESVVTYTIQYTW
jgi:hypothetical protein